MVGGGLPTPNAALSPSMARESFALNHIVTKPPLLVLCVSAEEDEKVLRRNCLLRTRCKKRPLWGKSFGAWLRYDSSNGTDGTYPEYGDRPLQALAPGTVLT